MRQGFIEITDESDGELTIIGLAHIVTIKPWKGEEGLPSAIIRLEAGDMIVSLEPYEDVRQALGLT